MRHLGRGGGKGRAVESIVRVNLVTLAHLSRGLGTSTRVVTSPLMAPQGGHGSGRRQTTGALTGGLVGAVFGLVFIEANSGELPRTWQLVARVGGAVVFVLLLIGIRRARRAEEAGEPASGTAFGRGYWLIVAAEAAALVGGLIVINVVVGAHELAVAWIALVVGVHFFALGILWKAGVFHVLGTTLTVLGIAGFALHAAGASALAVALVSGVASGIVLDLAAARAVHSSAVSGAVTAGHDEIPER